MAVYLPPPESLSTGIGGLPYKDPEEACDAVLGVFTEFPYVPLLPNRGFLENIVINDSEKLPGRLLEGEKLTVDRNRDLSPEMEQIYLDYIEGNFAPYSVGTAYASGFYSFLKRSFPMVYGVKCQVTGPVTFGMQVVDADKRPIYYDSQFADVLSKMLALRARWYEYELKEKTGVKNTLIILNAGQPAGGDQRKVECWIHQFRHLRHCCGSNYAVCFHDVTTGSNTLPSSPNLFYATNGYDLCTGLGTANGTNLINALAPLLAFSPRHPARPSPTATTPRSPSLPAR